MADSSSADKILTNDELELLEKQNSRLVTEYQAALIEREAKKYWDLFYKRNENRFFKDRHWTTREFKELLNDNSADRKVLLEVGCGAGNFVFPLIEDNLNVYIYACDFSPRAVNLVKTDERYDESKIYAFQCDVTTEDMFAKIKEGSVDIVSLVFVLSAVHPDKFGAVAGNMWRALRPGGALLFRDYGLYDMAQLRFKPGHKISENLYMRQDGTRSYYFSLKDLAEIFEHCGFVTISNEYVHRRTVNKKEDIDVPRIFIQAKFEKPALAPGKLASNLF